jgi:hypothetical protein
MNRLIATLALCAVLAGCETATLYQPSVRPDAVGYSDLRIEPGRYRVTFQGGGGAPAAQVEDYTLLRAAQVAVRDGYDWFRVVGREGETAPPRSSSAISIGGGSGSFGHGGDVGVGVGTTFDLSGGPRLSRTLEIICGHGPRPPEGDVYDARGVIATIGPRAGPARAS